MNFIDESARAKQRSNKQEELRAKAFARATESNEAKSYPTKNQFDVILASNRDLSVVPITPSWFLGDLNLAAFKDNIQISFTLANLFSGDARSISWLVWGYDTMDFNVNSSALKALSSMYYGRLNHQRDIENEGRMHYINTLRGINKAIESNAGTSIDILLACTSASCYEMIATSTHKKMLLHAGGVAKLIELRGPEQHRSKLELQVLNTVRNSICVKAILDRKRSFLQKTEWKTIPWSFELEDKTLVGQVQDIMCDIPGLLEDYDVLCATDTSSRDYRIRLEKLTLDVNACLGLLSEWRVLWERIYPALSHERVPSFTNSPFSTALYYQDLEAVNGLMIYNALYIRVSRLGIQLLGQHFDFQQAATLIEFQCTNPVLNSPGASLYDSAFEICRSAEYHLAPPHECAGAFFLLFPLRIAYDEFDSCSPVRTWIETFMEHIATRSGFSISRGILQQN